jgi:hypothetical protein
MDTDRHHRVAAEMVRQAASNVAGEYSRSYTFGNARPPDGTSDRRRTFLISVHPRSSAPSFASRWRGTGETPNTVHFGHTVASQVSGRMPGPPGARAFCPPPFFAKSGSGGQSGQYWARRPFSNTAETAMLRFSSPSRLPLRALRLCDSLRSLPAGAEQARRPFSNTAGTAMLRFLPLFTKPNAL